MAALQHLSCDYCNKKFSRHQSFQVLIDIKNVFCSVDCRIKYQKQSKSPNIGPDRICYVCNESKSLDNFKIRHILLNKSGIPVKHFMNKCNPCLYNFQMKRWNQRKVKAIKYLGGLCKRCGNSGHPAIFQFHHRDTSSKEFVWNKLRLKSWSKITKELDKCDLLHAHCHILEHIKPEMWDFKPKNKKSTLVGSIRNCINCNIEYKMPLYGKRNRKYCSSKCAAMVREKIIWPSDDELLKLFSEVSCLTLSKTLGVSDRAIRKRVDRINCSRSSVINL